jgi:hypothetical protein
MSSSVGNNKHLGDCAFLLPVYGGDKAVFFRRALESIFAQSVNSMSIRVYLGIDGPIDETLETVVKEFSLRIHKIIRSPMRQGVARNLNALISVLEDESFVFRMDADDVCLPNRVSLQLTYLNSHPEIGILGGAIQEIGSDGRNYGIRTYPQHGKVKNYIRYASPVAHPTVVFRRETLNILGGYPLAGFNEDIQMWFAALVKGIKIDNLTETILLYQVNNGFYNRRSYIKAFGEAKAYIVGNFRLHGISLALLLPVLRLIFRLMPGRIVRVLYHTLPLRRILLNTDSGKR